MGMHRSNFSTLPDEQILHLFNHAASLNEAIALSSTSRRMRDIFTDSVPGKALQYLDGLVDRNNTNQSRITISDQYWERVSNWGLFVDPAGPFVLVIGNIRLSGASQIVQFGKFIWPDHPETDTMNDNDAVQMKLLRRLLMSRVPSLAKRAMNLFYEREVFPKEILFHALIADIAGPMVESRVSWEIDLVSKLDEEEVSEGGEDEARLIVSLSKNFLDRPQLATKVMHMLYPNLPNQLFDFLESLPIIVQKSSTDAEAVARLTWVQKMNSELASDAGGFVLHRDHKTILGAVHDSQDWYPDFIDTYAKALRICKRKGWTASTALLQRDVQEYNNMLATGNLKPWPSRPWNDRS